MEKIFDLIEKLQELKQQNAGLNTLSYYSQMLSAEIMRCKNEERQQELKGKPRVSVILPFGDLSRVQAVPASPVDANPTLPLKDSAEDQVFSQQRLTQLEERKTVIENLSAATPLPEREQPAMSGAAQEKPPTTSHSGSALEINDFLVNSQPSLNDSLKVEKVELAEKLRIAPIKDLRHAIGINDKFKFIQDLFRGDPDGYERSIKTINGFNSFREADAWIERELKIKLGWEDQSEMVQEFYSNVKKRFS
ncbi:MAG: hypothetical protein ACYCOO_01750 [Chitinophagaceae bacterium]